MQPECYNIIKGLMQKLNIKKYAYLLRRDYLTFNNLVILVAFLIAASWVWGSLQVMQRNYGLQRAVDQKTRELAIAQLQRDSLELQKRFFQTNEYKELAARETLGLVMPGENLLILPANSAAASAEEAKPAEATVIETPASNLEQWINFLFGGYSKGMSGGNAAEIPKK